ncbi:TonB family protein [Collimonas pratensis]|uniref:TonB family protein n=1 Tax=Collimonas pratensis TaxID=279113 RepID=UPI00143DB7A6|nr:TonB family protein [Collimonas pratensis]
MNCTYPLSIAKEQGRWQAIALAVLVHAILLAGLWFGVSWKIATSSPIDAELWSPPADEAIPFKAAASKPVPATVQVKLASGEPATEKVSVPIEQRKRKIARQVSEDEGRVVPDLIPELESTQVAMQYRSETGKADSAGVVLEREKQEIAPDPSDDDQKQQQGEIGAVLDAGILPPQSARNSDKTADQPVLTTAKITSENLSENLDHAAWMARVNAMILSNVVFQVSSAERENNTPVRFTVTLLPDGSVGGMQMSRSSGIEAFDAAVRNAIEKSQPYPADDSGAVPSGFDSAVHTIDTVSPH